MQTCKTLAKSGVSTLIACGALLLLSSCGSGSTSSGNPSIEQRIAEAIIEHPEEMFEISSESYTNAMVRPTSIPGNPGELLITVDSLQKNYETKFCQLNDDYDITLDTAECKSNIAFIKQEPGTGNFDLNKKPIKNNTLGVTGVVFKPIKYQTTVELPRGKSSFNVSGGMMLPQGISGNKIKGVVTYFHGTAFNKAAVGSDYVNNGETQLLAEVFASQGYIVLLPDYVGQGVDWKNIHPYVLYPKVSVQTAVDMLNAVAGDLKNTYNLNSSAKLKLFSVGFSEGGAYSVWFSKLLNSSSSPALDALYQLKHSFGIAGAYNTENVMKGFFFDNVERSNNNSYNIIYQTMTNVAKPLFATVTMLSYGHYGTYEQSQIPFNASFYDMQCNDAFPQALCEVNGKQENLLTAVARESSDDFVKSILFSAMGKSKNGSQYPSLPLDIMFSHMNSLNSLVSPEVVSASGMSKLATALKAANVDLSSSPDKSISISTIDRDSYVTPNNSKALIEAYPSKLRDTFVIPGANLKVVFPLSYYIYPYATYNDPDHGEALCYELLYALNTFNQF